MLKRRLLLSVLGFICSYSFVSSASAYSGDNPFTGLYLAADVGAIQLLAKNKQNLTVTGSSVNATSSDDRPTQTDTNITGGVAIGFSYLADSCFYIAIEGRGDYQSPEAKNTRDTTATVTNGGTTSSIVTSTERSIKVKDTYSILLKPGFAIGQDRETVIYGIVGATTGKISAKSTANVTVTTGASTHNLSIESEQKDNRTTGVSGGIGVEHAFFTSNATIGAEYVYTDYGSVKFDNGSGTTTSGGTTVAAENKVDVSTNTVMVKVAYRFPV